LALNADNLIKGVGGCFTLSPEDSVKTMVYHAFTVLLRDFSSAAGTGWRKFNRHPRQGEEAMVESTMTRRETEVVRVQRDWRADGGDRRVRVTRSDILIARRFGGIAMRIQVPVPAYRGVFLDVIEGADGAPCYRLLLAHADRDLDVVLEEAGDGDALEAVAQDWASWLGVPLLAATEDAFEDAAEAAHAPIPRRGGSPLRGRRPRFLMRRHIGETARMGQVFAGERVIVSYE
jgi:Family of unknown function (DUF6101)